ncbi:hypothetical protein SD457_10105 [Coprobacillaceae bacterium CR2/5/TPMF4]|nr:hypothetical protein SD457_10105 [Coprobacillaceae bacterium CR2/5/TPMF4]
MAKEKEILRLRSLGMSQKAIMSVVHCASRKIKSTYEKADELSITYELIKDKTDDEIEEIFGNKKEVIYYHERPDYDYVHKELLKPGVTVMLLWEEYVERCKLENKPFLKYTQFSKLYKKHVEKNNLTMHIGKNRVKRLKSILQDRLYQSMICHEDKSYPKLIFSLQCFLLVNIFIVKQPTT